MKILKTHYILLLCFCLCLCGLLFAALSPAEPVLSAEPPPTREQLEQQLVEAEQTLQEHREELADLLRAYYMGHAGEKETKRLIEQVEEERLHVEELQAAVNR